MFVCSRISYLEEVSADMQEAMNVARQSLCQSLAVDNGSVSSSSSSGIQLDILNPVF